MTVPHLQRVEIDFRSRITASGSSRGTSVFISGIYIQKKLGGIPDARHRVEGVPSPQERKIRHRIQLEKIRTGNPEKVPHHQIGIPDRLKLGKAVKHIEGVASFFCNLLMDRHGKGLEAVVGIKLSYFDPGQIP